ncbi:hypothetical protein Dimus_016836 [Dionaea muscipula]
MSKSLVTSTTKLKSLWDFEHFKHDEDCPSSGCPWPPRHYTCSFCGKEFRSAQALGGHMNIHRRDRARLRDQSLSSSSSSSWVNANVDLPNSNPNPNPRPNPNPNPNTSSSTKPSFPNSTTTPSSNIYSHQYSLLTLSLSSFSSPALESTPKNHEAGAPNHLSRDHNSKDQEFDISFSCGDRVMEGFKARKVNVQLDLELSLIGGGKEELDLELRLGTC